MRLGRPLLWLGGLWVGTAIHLDWHLGRPGTHHTLSFHFAWHWLFALPAIAPLAWLVRQKAGADAFRLALLILGLGVILGQGFEPLLLDGWDFAGPVRWRIFFQFLAASVVTWLVTDRLAVRVSVGRGAAAPSE